MWVLILRQGVLISMTQVTSMRKRVMRAPRQTGPQPRNVRMRVSIFKSEYWQ